MIRWCVSPSQTSFDRSACKRGFSALRLTFAANAASTTELFGARRQATRRKRTGFSGRIIETQYSYPHHFHDRSRGYPDDGKGHEGRRRGIPDQAFPRTGLAGCGEACTGTGSKPDRVREGFLRTEV